MSVLTDGGYHRSVSSASKDLPFIQVVAGLLIENGKFLIAKRLASDSLGGLWEFPGGKVEAGESHEQALYRELLEELNLYTRPIELFGVSEFQTPRAQFALSLYRCQRLSGQIVLCEHSEFAWIEIQDIPRYEFVNGDVPLLEKLKSTGLVRY